MLYACRRRAKPITRLTEDLAVGIWRDRLYRLEGLVTEEGQPFRIIYPGRINHDRGADLTDAVILQDSRLVRGDIEVHIRSSSWQEHRHHLDPAYNRVILHLVFFPDAAAITQSGRPVGTVSLERFLDRRAPDHGENVLPCQCSRPGTGLTINVLEHLGEKRFFSHGARIEAGLAKDPAQCLYREVMGALGYAKNKLPFIQIADRMPLKRLEHFVEESKPETQPATRQALLLGTAGLLPVQHEHDKADPYLAELQGLWNATGLPQEISSGSWSLCKIRPVNLPARRLIAASNLISRYGKRLNITRLAGAVTRSPPKNLVKALLVPSTGYWAHHLDLGRPSPRPLPHLLGASRASDIVINVLLPLALAWGKMNAMPDLCRRSLELYRNFPPLQSNAIESHMKTQLGLGGALVNSAARQQGLLQVYKSLCSQGKCAECPLTKG